MPGFYSSPFVFVTSLYLALPAQAHATAGSNQTRTSGSRQSRLRSFGVRRLAAAFPQDSLLAGLSAPTSASKLAEKNGGKPPHSKAALGLPLRSYSPAALTLPWHGLSVS